MINGIPVVAAGKLLTGQRIVRRGGVTVPVAEALAGFNTETTENTETTATVVRPARERAAEGKV
jgi:hypothetical protein